MKLILAIVGFVVVSCAQDAPELPPTDQELRTEIRSFVFDPCMDAVHRDFGEWSRAYANRQYEELMGGPAEDEMIRIVRSAPDFGVRLTRYNALVQTCISLHAQ